jgi:hypothetical protein
MSGDASPTVSFLSLAFDNVWEYGQCIIRARMVYIQMCSNVWPKISNVKITQKRGSTPDYLALFFAVVLGVLPRYLPI